MLPPVFKGCGRRRLLVEYFTGGADESLAIVPSPLDFLL